MNDVQEVLEGIGTSATRQDMEQDGDMESAPTIASSPYTQEQVIASNPQSEIIILDPSQKGIRTSESHPAPPTSREENIEKTIRSSNP